MSIIPMKNAQLALRVLEFLQFHGVREICICPSTRLSPLVMAVQANLNHFKIYTFFEERCASFFALGRIQQTGKPVAVMVTSGTAVGELLPATMEAHYSGLPLILITADQPRRYRGSGAPQSADQANIFGPYVFQVLDLEGPHSNLSSDWQVHRPLQVNVCFEEPFLELVNGASLYPLIENEFSPDRTILTPSHLASFSEEEWGRVKEFFCRSAYPLVILGGIAVQARDSVLGLLQQWNFPVYAEAFSGLREESKLDRLRVFSPERVFERAHANGYPIDGVIRIGTVPTLRFWRDLDLKQAFLPVLSLSHLDFSGLGRNSSLIYGDLVHTCKKLSEFTLNFEKKPISFESFLVHERELKQNVDQLLESEPTSEPSLFRAISRQIPDGAQVFIGNSMPIRQWDLAAIRDNRTYSLAASRGLNGIDGQISTYLGYAKLAVENWGIFGDLTALYDLQGPWILKQLADINVRIVVVNNQGGKIFSRISLKDPIFQNHHELHFRSWAQLWGLDYENWREVPVKAGSSKSLSGGKNHRIIEVTPDSHATDRFWARHHEIHL